MLKRPLMRPRDQVRCEEWRALLGKITSQKREILTAGVNSQARMVKSLEQDKFFFIHQATLGEDEPPPVYLPGQQESLLDADAFFDFSPTRRRRSSPGAARARSPASRGGGGGGGGSALRDGDFPRSPSTTRGDRRASRPTSAASPPAPPSYVRFTSGPHPRNRRDSSTARRSSRHRPRSVGAVAATPPAPRVRVALNRRRRVKLSVTLHESRSTPSW